MAEPTPPRQDKPRVLVVDDDDAKRYTLCHPLKAAGIQVEEAANAGEALEKARSDPELILLDVKLPDESGFEVCRKLKAHPATASIPVLYVSAHFRSSEDRVQGLLGGADGYLVTPIHHDELVATVQVWLRVRRAERERSRLMLQLDRERAFLEQVVHQLPLVAIIAEAPGGRILLANARAEQVFGPGIHALRHAADYAATFPARRPDGTPLAAEDYPLARALRGEALRGVEVEFSRADGTPLAMVVSATPIRDGNGQIVAAITAAVDITDRRKMESQSRELARLREELIGILGHDLRNPLQAIRMGLQVLGTGELPARQDRAAKRIAASADRMRRMVDDMLDFASTEMGGHVQMRRRAMDLATVVTDVVEELRIGYPDRPLELAVSGNVHGSWDPDRIAQVISNLGANALTHSPPHSPVTVTVSADPRGARVVVHNAGAIPAEILPDLFAPLRRGEQSSGRGAGLGLYITKKIIDAHGGRVEVTSSEDEGTRFTVDLPFTE